MHENARRAKAELKAPVRLDIGIKDLPSGVWTIRFATQGRELAFTEVYEGGEHSHGEP